MSYLPTLDGDVRQRAITDLNTTFLVEAGAGTGKTNVLLQRLLTIVRTGRGQLERIVTITFTEKAATELRVRLSTEIDIALAGPLSESERRNLFTARIQLDRASIATVHAFCAALLRERPIEARVDSSFAILNESSARLLRTETWNEWLAQERDYSPTVLKQALRAGLTLAHLETLRDFLVEHRDCLNLLPEPLASPLSEYRSTLRESLTRLSSLSASCVNPTDRAMIAIQDLEELLPENEEDSVWEQILLRDLSLNAAVGAKANWKPVSALDEVRAVLHHMYETHTHARSVVMHNLTIALARWLEGFVEAYDRKKHEQSSLDFTDLLLRTRNLLAHHPEERRYFQRRFDFLLVDEFQDTDPLQAEIVFFLAEREPKAREWTSVDLQPGRLFLVGDPQQSIYRFRRADLDVYTQVRQAVERQGEVLSLSTNFRSRAPVVSWINDTFTRTFAAADRDQPAYRALTAVRHEHTGHEVIVLPVPEDLVAPQASREELRQAEARTVAAFLKQAVERGHFSGWKNHKVRYSDIAILFRTYQAMDNYEAALRTAGVPHRVVGGRRYSSRQEIMELRTLLQTIANPSETTALVATLRSSLFGFSDEELAQFVAEGGTFQYLSPRVPPSLPSTEHFTAAFALLRDLHVRCSQMQPAMLLYDIYTRSHLLPFFALRPHGVQRVANLLKLLDLASLLAAQGVSTLAAFNRFLHHQDNSALEEEPAIIEGEDSVVRLLTIHKAKGLEFPVVIVADASGPQGSRSSRPGILERVSHRLELAVGPRSLTCATQGWQKAEAREQEREAAEEQRLRYVAAARARDHLIIPSTPQRKGERNILQWAFGEEEVFVYQIDAQTICQLEQEIQATSSFPIIDFHPAAYGVYQTWKTERQAVLAKGRGEKKAGDLDTQELLCTHTTQPDKVFFPTPSLARLRLGRLIRQAVKAEQKREIVPPVPVARQTENAAGAETPDFTQLVENVFASTVLVRARAGTEQLVDTPFTLQHENGLLEGRIDLAFLEEGAWVVVKLETDASPQSKEQEQVYRSQLLLSAFALERLTGRSIKALVLLLVGSQSEVLFTWSEHERTYAESLLEMTLSIIKEPS